MRSFLGKRYGVKVMSVILTLCICAMVPLSMTGCNDSEASSQESETSQTSEQTAQTTQETTEETTQEESTEVEVEVETVVVNSGKTKSETSSKKKTTSSKKSEDATEATTETETVSFATAATGSQKVSYSTQWDAGYLVAVDYPDTSYSCEHIELTDENRDLLERLCMGEFGSGGFVGAALIAQAVKNAMATYGYDSVQDVITNMHYKGKLKNNPTNAVKKAVIYVFDMDKDAIQHRILYMYNPKLVQSAFHESQNYICTYKNVRFFDR